MENLIVRQSKYQSVYLFVFIYFYKYLILRYAYLEVLVGAGVTRVRLPLVEMQEAPLG